MILLTATFAGLIFVASRQVQKKQAERRARKALELKGVAAVPEETKALATRS
jgi:nitrogen fixation protein FixH